MFENILLSGKDQKVRFLETLMPELYWNDYLYTVEEIYDLLEQKDPIFLRHFFGRIIQNASFATQALLKLFPEAELNILLQETVVQGNQFARKRFDSVKFNITQKGKSGVPEWV